MATAAASATPRRRLLPPWITSYERVVAAPRRDRRPRDLVGRHAPGGRLRADRRPAAAGRADGRARRDGRLRAVRDVAPARRLGDDGDERALAPRPSGRSPTATSRRSPRVSAMLAIVVGVVLIAGGALQARRGRRPRLQARDDRLPVRPRVDHHHLAGHVAARHPGRRRELLPARCGTSSTTSATSTATTLAVGAGSLAVLVVGRRVAPKVPATLVVLGAGDRALRAAAPRRPRGRRRRQHPQRAAGPGGPARLRPRHHRADRARARRPGAERRGGRRRAPAGDEARLLGRRQPRPDGDGRGQRGRGLLQRVRPVRRRVADRGGRRRGRPQPVRDRRLRRPAAADRRVPGAAVRAPAAGDAGGDRDRRGVELPRRRASCGGSRGSAAARSSSPASASPAC